MSLTIPVSEIVAQSRSPLLSKHETWLRVTLGEIARVLNGFAFSSENFQRERGIPLIRIRDILNNSTDCLYDGDFDDTYLVNKDDLLIGMDGDFNCALWKGPVGLLNQRVGKVEVNQNFFDKKFLSYLLPGYLKAINDATSSITVKHLSSRSVEEIPLPLPPLAEQQRIVEAIEQQFSRLDEAVMLLRRAQTKLKRYRASVLKAAAEGELTKEWRAAHPASEPASALLQRILAERRAKWEEEQIAKGRDPQKVKYVEPAAPDVKGLPELPVGWCWATVEQLGAAEPNSITDGPFGSNLKTEHYREQGGRVIRLQNIGNGDFRDEKAFIDLEHLEMLKKHRIFAGDLVIAALGENPPRSCIIPEFVGPAIVKADCIRFKVTSHVFNTFVNYALNSEPTSERTSKKLHGVGRPRLNLSEIKSIEIPLPPLAEQEQIVAIVEERLSIIAEMEASIGRALKRAERQRQSILHRAFTGKLVSQDPDDEPASLLLERIRAEREQAAQQAGQQKRARATQPKESRSVTKSIKVPEQPAEPIDTTNITQESLWQSIEVI